MIFPDFSTIFPGGTSCHSQKSGVVFPARGGFPWSRNHRNYCIRNNQQSITFLIPNFLIPNSHSTTFLIPQFPDSTSHSAPEHSNNSQIFPRFFPTFFPRWEKAAVPKNAALFLWGRISTEPGSSELISGMAPLFIQGHRVQ